MSSTKDSKEARSNEDSKEDPTPGPSQEAYPGKQKKSWKSLHQFSGVAVLINLMLLARMIQFQDQARKLILKSHYHLGVLSASVISILAQNFLNICVTTKTLVKIESSDVESATLKTL